MLFGWYVYADVDFNGCVLLCEVVVYDVQAEDDADSDCD